MDKEDRVVLVDRIVENILSIHPLVARDLTREIRAKRNLTPGVVYLLKNLYNEEPLSMKEIGNRLNIPKPHATLMVDRLITENLAERLYDEKDRRVIKIKLTDEGRKYYLEVKQAIGCEMKKRIQTLDDQTLTRMSDASQFIHDTLHEFLQSE